MRVLYIARYRSEMMERKIELMANQPDVEMWLIRPTSWQDEYGRIDLPPPRNEKYHTIPVPLLGQHTDHHRVLYRTCSFSLRTVQPDIIHAEEEPDSLAALQVACARKALAPKALLVLHTWQNVNRSKAWYVQVVLRSNFGQADAILCANQEAEEVLAELGYCGVTDVILQQGIDMRVFHPDADGKSTSGQFTVTYAGRLASEKGLDTLFEAVAQLNTPARLCLVGDGPARAALEARAHRLDADIEFVGAVAADDMPNLLHQSDVLVLPSRTTAVWKEQFGRVLGEAMACKVPVVGSDSGAIPEVIGDAGLIFPEGDADALADCLRRLSRSPDLCGRLADCGYERVSQLYTQEHLAKRTVHFYRELLDNVEAGVHTHHT